LVARYSIPNPEQIDMGYTDFMSRIDALVMGKNTFETICGFDMDWPYEKPIFVLSNSLEQIPGKFQHKAQLVKGTLTEILTKIHELGHQRLYIDGETTMQELLKKDRIDKMIITLIPVLLAGGIPLFSDLPKPLDFECLGSKIYLDSVVQDHFVRKRPKI
jgi:dihydrofolate reductase